MIPGVKYLLASFLTKLNADLAQNCDRDAFHIGSRDQLASCFA